jgi:hypothetical protein
VRVVEVNRPDRRQRRMHGKSDPLDAYAAAEAVPAGRARARPQAADGHAEVIGMPHLTRQDRLDSPRQKDHVAGAF